MNNLLKVVFVAGCVATLGAPGRAQEAGTQALAATSRQISVVGNGTITATPDILRINLVVQADALEASDAIRSMSAQMEDVLSTLAEAGLATDDMQTAGLRLSPRYSAPRDGSSPPALVGFVASSDLTIVVRDMTQSGRILDAVVASGVTQINGLQLDVSDRAPLLAQARRAAVADAIAKTKLYADAAELAMGDVLRIEEINADGGFPQSFNGAAARSVPIAVGTFDVSAQVTIVTSVE